MADEDTPDTGLGQRVKSLEDGQQSILSKLDRLLSGGPQPPAEPERPEVSISEEIRRQLDERDRRNSETEPAPAPKPEPEQPPKAPVRKITKALWGDE